MVNIYFIVTHVCFNLYLFYLLLNKLLKDLTYLYFSFIYLHQQSDLLLSMIFLFRNRFGLSLSYDINSIDPYVKITI